MSIYCLRADFRTDESPVSEGEANDSGSEMSDSTERKAKPRNLNQKTETIIKEIKSWLN